MPKKKPVNINQVRRAKLNQWMENIDGTFKALLMPVAFIMSVTWGFMFFYGQDVSSGYIATLRTEFLRVLTFQFGFLIAPLGVWCVSNFVERVGRKVVVMKWLSLNGLWFVFLAIPASIIISYFANVYNLRSVDVAGMYSTFVIILIACMCYLTRPPRWRL